MYTQTAHVINARKELSQPLFWQGIMRTPRAKWHVLCNVNINNISNEKEE